LGKASARSALKIAIVPFAEPGHVNATLRLYAELTELGHEVRYICLMPGQENLFEQRGVPHILERFSDLDVGVANAASALDGFQPELVLVDSVIPHVAMFAWRYGIPVIKLSTVFPQRYDAIVPPLSTSIVPTDDPQTRARVASAWEVEYRRNRSRPRASMLIEHARQLGFPLAWLDERSTLNVTCRLPELALVPRELDFPRSDVGDLHFAGACVDLDRKEPATIPEQALSADKPLIY
jgi:UDP:flavonoid glycosyltransferase YjiC (YdhE family)